MKIRFVITLLLLSTFSWAQQAPDTCSKYMGVYLTCKAYKSKELAAKVCSSDNLSKIKIGINNSSVTVKEKDRKTVFKSKSIYGYSDGKATFRYYEIKGAFSDYGYFKIQDTSFVTIYSMLHTISGKYGSSSRTTYYFSKTPDSPIRTLNAKNIADELKDPKLEMELKGIEIYKKSGNHFLINEKLRQYYNN